MLCPYEDDRGMCHYMGHEHPCGYNKLHNEWGCPIARHYYANRKTVENLLKDLGEKDVRDNLPK